MQPRLLSFDPHSPYFNDAVAVYLAYTGSARLSSRRYFADYSTRPDYRGLVALDGEQVIGVAVGTRSSKTDWWHERVAFQVGEHHLALQNAWVLIELHVREAYRSQGIGGMLHDTIISQQPYDRLLLSTMVSNTRAQAFYHQRGWKVLHPGFAFIPGDQPFMILHKQLNRSVSHGQLS